MVFRKKGRNTRERVVVMHFLKSRTNAVLLAERINQVQLPIPEFCQAALNGELTKSGWLKSPGANIIKTPHLHRCVLIIF